MESYTTYMVNTNDHKQQKSFVQTANTEMVDDETVVTTASNKKHEANDGKNPLPRQMKGNTATPFVESTGNSITEETPTPQQQQHSVSGQAASGNTSNPNSESWIRESTTADKIVSSSTSNAINASSSSSLRSVIGSASIELSQLVNDNLIVVRFMSILSISALGVYAFTQTPLFFRYHNVADIPSNYFQRRKTITGRLMMCHQHNTTSNQRHTATSIHHRSIPQQQSRTHEGTAVTCYVRHLSPIESMLSKKWLHRYWNLTSNAHTTRIITSAEGSDTNYNNNNDNSPEGTISELIQVQIAGIQYPKITGSNNNNNNDVDRNNLWHSNTTDGNYTTNKYSLQNFNTATTTSGTNYQHSSTSFGQDWIQKLSQNQCLVRCQFLGRKVPIHDNNNISHNSSYHNKSKPYLNKRPIPGMIEAATNIIESTIPIEEKLQNQVAIVKLYIDPDSDRLSNQYGNRNDGLLSLYQYFKNLFRRRNDLGETMIKNGYAVVSGNSGLLSTTTTSSSSSIVVDTTTSHATTQHRDKQLQQDLRYIDQLVRVEYKAAQSYTGIWNNPQYRTERSDIVDEIHFQQHSTILQKIFRYIRGR